MRHEYGYDAGEVIRFGPPPKEYARWARELADADRETDQGYQGHPEPIFEAAVALAEALPVQRLSELAEFLSDQVEIREERSNT